MQDVKYKKLNQRNEVTLRLLDQLFNWLTSYLFRFWFV